MEPAKACSTWSQSQRDMVLHIQNSINMLGPIREGLTGGGALQQLHAFHGYGDSQTPCSVKPYKPELLSLPSRGSEAVPLEKLIGETGCDVVGDFIDSHLLPEDEARKRIKSIGLREAYSDPRLREPRTYRAFVQRLQSADIVD